MNCRIGQGKSIALFLFLSPLPLSYSDDAERRSLTWKGKRPLQRMSQGNNYRLPRSSSRMRCRPRVITIANPAGDAPLISIFCPVGSRADDVLVFPPLLVTPCLSRRSFYGHFSLSALYIGACDALHDGLLISGARVYAAAPELCQTLLGSEDGYRYNLITPVGLRWPLYALAGWGGGSYERPEV